MATAFSPVALLLTVLFGGSWLLPIGLPPNPEDPALLRGIPEKCLVLLEYRGVAEADPASTNEVERLLAEPEMKEFNQGITRIFSTAARGALGRENAVLAQELPSILQAILARPAIVYLGSLDIPGAGPPELSGGIVMGAGPMAESLERSLRALIQTAGLQVQSPAGETAGARIETLLLPPDAPPMAWGRRGSTIFLGLGKGEAEGIARRLAGESPGGVPADFARERASLAVERPGFLVQVDVAGIMEALPADLRSRMQPILDALGLSAVTSIHTAGGLDRKSSTAALLIKTRGKLRGLLAPYEAPPLARADLSSIPADATVAAAGRTDADAIFREFQDIVGRIDPRARERLAREILAVESELGFQFSEDLLQPLGTSWSLYSSPAEGGLLVTGLTLAAAVRDEARLRRTIDRLTSLFLGDLSGGGRGALVPPQSFPFGDQTIYYLDLPSAAHSGDMIPIAPCWSFGGGKFLVSLFPQILKAHLRPAVAGTAGAPPFADLPEVAGLWENGRAPLGIVRIDTRAFFRILYPFLPPLFDAAASMARRQGLEIPLTLLPSAPAIEPHLLPAVLALYRTADGILITQKGGSIFTSGLPALALPVTFLWFGVRVPMAGSRSVAPPNIDDQVRLRTLASAIELFRLDHARYPASLEELVQGGYLKADLLAGLQYFGSGESSLPDGSIVAAAPARNGRRMVLLADGQTQSFPESDARLRARTKP